MRRPSQTMFVCIFVAETDRTRRMHAGIRSSASKTRRHRFALACKTIDPAYETEPIAWFFVQAHRCAHVRSFHVHSRCYNIGHEFCFRAGCDSPLAVTGTAQTRRTGSPRPRCGAFRRASSRLGENPRPTATVRMEEADVRVSGAQTDRADANGNATSWKPV